mmetsp:Transcript_19939/g.46841  ORF Transcript_19939/g.46841 Transcript_19939/m.46841 type:complete len:204 (-) Transcript_19939:469-1080(-)
MPSEACHLLVMSPERTELSHGPDVVQFHELISARGQEPVAVVVPGDFRHCVLVAVQCAEARTSPRIPKLYEIVLRTGAYHAAPGVPLDGLDVPAVSLERPLLPMSRPVPYPHCRVVTAAHKLCIVRTKAQCVHRVAVVAIYRLDRRDARAPVLYVSACVTRQKVVLVVRPGHRAEGRVVRRHDELEGEVHAVPKRELPLLISR